MEADPLSDRRWERRYCDPEFAKCILPEVHKVKQSAEVFGDSQGALNSGTVPPSGGVITCPERFETELLDYPTPRANSSG